MKEGYKMNFQQHAYIGNHFNDQNWGCIFFSRTINRRLLYMPFGEVCALSGDHIDISRHDPRNTNLYLRLVNQDIHRFFEVGLEIVGALSRRERSWGDLMADMSHESHRWDHAFLNFRFDGYGDYISGARSNWHHFLPISQWTWHNMHLTACNLAKRIPIEERRSWIPGRENIAFPLDFGNTLPSSEGTRHDLAMALFVEACAGHFLMDCFAAGHIRTLRAFFGSGMPAFRAQEAHDNDNNWQINAVNNRGRLWSLTGEFQEEDRFESGSRISGDTSRLDPVKTAVRMSVEHLFTIPQNESVNRINNTIGSIRRNLPKQSIYWLPAGCEEAVEKGYQFITRPVSVVTERYINDLHDNSVILHVEILGERRPPHFNTNTHERLPSYILVADLSLGEGDRHSLNNLRFYHHFPGTTRYGKPESSRSTVYRPDGVERLQNWYFPMSGDGILTRVNNYWTRGGTRHGFRVPNASCDDIIPAVGTSSEYSSRDE